MTMEFETASVTAAIDTFLLLLIGVGPKIALVPFLEATADLSAATKRAVVRKMLTTAAIVAVILLVLGGVLTRLLHFSPGALGVSSGIILLILAVSMVLSPADPDGENKSLKNKDPMQLAVFPLAVPYVINPAGIVVLVTASAEAASFGVFAIVVGALAVVLAIDVAVFRWANKVSKHLDQNRMLLTEKVFGFLLAALAVQLALGGLSDLGVIHLAQH
jgi:small neutral amino acid transporter SnatA (MarC family)